MVLSPSMMTTRREIEQWLQEGILAAKSGQLEQARFRLLDVVEQDQTNETAWFWLYQVFERPNDKQVCLENLLIINPYNEWARQELRQYNDNAYTPAMPLYTPSAPAPGPPALAVGVTQRSPRPFALKVGIAFWGGISIIFLGVGIIASGQWLALFVREGVTATTITAWQIIDLVISLSFVTAGFFSMGIALALFFRSMAGFYGSLLMGLALLLVGPTISLIARPPNYAAMICLGGMAGMMVLLTLASQPGLKDS